MKIKEILTESYDHIRDLSTDEVRKIAIANRLFGFGDIMGSVFRRVEFGQALYRLSLGNGSNAEIYVYGEPGNLRAKHA